MGHGRRHAGGWTHAFEDLAAQALVGQDLTRRCRPKQNRWRYGRNAVLNIHHLAANELDELFVGFEPTELLG